MKRNQVRRDVVLFKDDVDWFKSHYQYTTLSGVLSQMLSEFRKLHGANSPKIYIEQATSQFKQQLEK